MRHRQKRSTVPTYLPVLFSFLALPLAVAGCAGRSSHAPELFVGKPQLEANTVDTIVAVAHNDFLQGKQLHSEGDLSAADDFFDRALETLLKSEVTPEDEDRLRGAFNDLVNRIAAVNQTGMSEIKVQPSRLPEETIPPLSIAELEMLRTRLAASMPPLPRFSIPVPDPLENQKVLETIEYLTTARREVIGEGLQRAQHYLPMIRRAFDEVGAPQELIWVPLIESLFKPWVQSHASARGMWQFMAGTARLYGMRVDWYVDQRLDPVVSTHTAARYLKDLYAELGSWELSLAAYNGGKGRVGRAIRNAGTNDFWELAQTRFLPRETRDFVPKIMAAILIGSDPGHYGFNIELVPEFNYDEVTIDSMTDLRIIAECAGVTLKEIRDLNPHLLRMTTPRSNSYTVRVPIGTTADFYQAFAAIPSDERVMFSEHLVTNGETLSAIAARYDTSIAAITEMNNITNRNRIRAGVTLLVPVGQPSWTGSRYVSTPANRLAAAGSPRPDGSVVHTVRRGDNLSGIAGTYGVSVNTIQRLNGLTSNRIYPGDQLVVVAGPARIASTHTAMPSRTAAVASEASAAATESVTYLVQRGDNITTIARRFGVSVQDVLVWNGLSSRALIHPGDKLTIHDTAYHDATAYRVRRGDNLSSIARSFDVSVADLCSWNGITTRTTLYPGDELLIQRPTPSKTNR